MANEKAKEAAPLFTRADADMFFHMSAAARMTVAGNVDGKDFHKRRAYAALGVETPAEAKIIRREDAARAAAAKGAPAPEPEPEETPAAGAAAQ